MAVVAAVVNLNIVEAQHVLSPEHLDLNSLLMCLSLRDKDQF